MIYQYVVVRLVSSYGNLRAVPVGPLAEGFAKIAGAKTLTPAVLREIAVMGLPIAADGSVRDLRAMEAAMRCVQPRDPFILIPYTEGMEEELDPMMESHLDNKARHGT